MKKAIYTATILLLLLSATSVTCASAEVYLGPNTGSGYVNLTNPDDSYYYFDSSNMTMFPYVHNMPDGWWVLQLPADDTWVIGWLLGIVAFTIAIIALVRRKNNNDEY